MGFSDFVEIKKGYNSELNYLQKKMSAYSEMQYQIATGSTEEGNFSIFASDNDNNGINESEILFERTDDGSKKIAGIDSFDNNTGNIKERTIFDQDGESTIKIKYDERGNHTRFETIDKDGNSTVTEYEYYKDGSLKSTTKIGPDGKKETTYQDSFLERLFKR